MIHGSRFKVIDLKDYIAETLVQITNGIIEAQKQLKDVDVIVNPAKTFGTKGDYCKDRGTGYCLAQLKGTSWNA